ncbi:MAG: PEP-CTERM/exosortase system-associated acyltransferase [Halioglobus sp.]
MYSHVSSIADDFLDYFEVNLSTTQRQREEFARMRYKVYCTEFGFENAADFPQGQEVDEFDDYSYHCLLTHKRSGTTAGGVRLVCASETDVLPLQKYCLNSVYTDYAEPLLIGQDSICEFSRLTVDTAFRRRRGEGYTNVGEYDAFACSHQERRTFSLIGVAAFISAIALADLTNRPKIYGMMESNVPRLLRRSGLLVQQAGDFMDYHGQRAPYYLSTELALSNMRSELLDLYYAIHHDLSENFIARESVA